MKISKRTRVPLILLALALLVPGCALRKQNPSSDAPVASLASSTPHCSDRVDRARTGNLVGSILGTIAASLIGSPFLGVFYKTAGYVIGFASSNPKCPKADTTTESKSSVNKAEPSSSAVIVEEEL